MDYQKHVILKDSDDLKEQYHLMLEINNEDARYFFLNTTMNIYDLDLKTYKNEKLLLGMKQLIFNSYEFVIESEEISKT